MKVIVNTNVILEDSVLFDGVVAIKDGIIQAVSKKDEFVIPPNAEVIDANGLYTAPGLIDIHNHGSKNNFFDEDTRECCEYFIKHGQTSVYPTFYSTCTAQEMIDGAKKLKDFSQTHELGQMIKGIYMEGPYMMNVGSNQKYMKWGDEIKKENYQSLIENLKGFAKVWAIDPDRKGIEEFIQDVKEVDKKAIFSFGHSMATAKRCEEIYPMGIKLQTHHGDSGQAPKINQARCDAGCDEFTLCTKEMYAEVICDQNCVHLGEYTIRLALMCKGREKIILITDSYPTKTNYKNAEEKGVKFGPDLNYDEEGLLAGSHLTLDKAVRNVIKHTNCSVVDAIRFASINPATLMGIEKDYGSIKEGKVADVILIDGEINVKKVFLKGKEII